MTLSLHFSHFFSWGSRDAHKAWRGTSLNTTMMTLTWEKSILEPKSSKHLISSFLLLRRTHLKNKSAILFPPCIVCVSVLFNPMLCSNEGRKKESNYRELLFFSLLCFWRRIYWKASFSHDRNFRTPSIHKSALNGTNLIKPYTEAQPVKLDQCISRWMYAMSLTTDISCTDLDWNYCMYKYYLTKKQRRNKALLFFSFLCFWRRGHRKASFSHCRKFRTPSIHISALNGTNLIKPYTGYQPA